MKIHRDIEVDLLRWKQAPERKPLILRGTRQIGKTWVMKSFGQAHFDNVAYFDFDTSEALCREFEQTKDPHRLLDRLRLYTEQPIEAERTLIVFDEIQQCNKALNSLKYFCEEAPQYPIIAAGSLLGVSLSKGDSFPVGKVDFLRMYPVSFREFLRADSPKIYEYLESVDKIAPLPEIVSERAMESYRRYQVCGGMPAAAVAMLEKKSMQEVEKEQNAILDAYALDFSKHAPGVTVPRIAAIWQSLPSQLAKENRKFVYKLVKTGARAREYEESLLWLEHAGLVHRVFCSSKPGLPISAYDNLDAFKLYLCDSGLLRVLAKLPVDIVSMENPLYAEFKGALAENRVLQSLVANFEVMPRYWASQGTAEIDFLLQRGASLLPVEVKAGTSRGGKSLGVYMSRFQPEVALRYSMNSLQWKNGILDIPLFLADWTARLLKIV